ncbi:DUF423 domain-containing protein [Psychrobacter sp. I-STPA6b]|uniref:DUF423 domain-containing protein n=1 Tax=Psychrobacter sp. I-STPA6b TaxID=2585718 RepID=UPI001D0C5880|nr:DUF423 domain-containing protein [Psychrobacter sp. I-STPA6b]
MNWTAISAINMALAVALGAFGAHAIKAIASIEQLAWWQTATQYFFYNALGLLFISILIRLGHISQTPAWLIQTGIILFSGSLYLMTLGAPRWFGAITPIGGTLMIVGWLWLAFTALRYQN